MTELNKSIIDAINEYPKELEAQKKENFLVAMLKLFVPFGVESRYITKRIDQRANGEWRFCIDDDTEILASPEHIDPTRRFVFSFSDKNKRYSKPFDTFDEMVPIFTYRTLFKTPETFGLMQLAYEHKVFYTHLTLGQLNQFCYEYPRFTTTIVESYPGGSAKKLVCIRL